MISKSAPSNALHTVYPNLQMASLLLSLNIKLGYMRTYLAALQYGNGILLTFKGIVHPKMKILSLKLFQTCMSFLFLLNIKGDILESVSTQTVDFHSMDENKY